MCYMMLPHAAVPNRLCQPGFVFKLFRACAGGPVTLSCAGPVAARVQHGDGEAPRIRVLLDSCAFDLPLVAGPLATASWACCLLSSKRVPSSRVAVCCRCSQSCGAKWRRRTIAKCRNRRTTHTTSAQPPEAVGGTRKPAKLFRLSRIVEAGLSAWRGWLRRANHLARCRRDFEGAADLLQRCCKLQSPAGCRCWSHENGILPVAS